MHACRVAWIYGARVKRRRRVAADWRRGSCGGSAARPMARGHVTWLPAPARLFTNNNNRAGGAGGAASTPRPLRATSYAQLSLHLAGFDSEHSPKASICLLEAFALAFYRSTQLSSVSVATTLFHCYISIRRSNSLTSFKHQRLLSPCYQMLFIGFKRVSPCPITKLFCNFCWEGETSVPISRQVDVSDCFAFRM